MKYVPGFDSGTLFSSLFEFWAMWQPTWNGHPFQGCPQSPSLGSPLGQHPGVLQCDPMGSQLSPCGPTGQWLPPGQGVWHPPNVMTSPGMNSGCHHPGVSGPPVAHGPPTMPFQSVNIHQGQDPIPSPTPSTPLPSSGLDISQLEERLGAL